MSCTAPQREHAALLDLESRVRRMEGCLSRGRVMARDAGGWPLYFLPMFSRERVDTTSSRFTLLWGTYENSSFSVEESADGVRWWPAADIVEAASGESTSWTSGVYGLTENPWFRAVLLRPSLVCCALPDESLPRYFEKVIGPTGGSRYGGCTDCAGDFPVCDIPDPS